MQAAELELGGAGRTASLRGRGAQAEGAGRAREGLGRGAAGLLEGRGRRAGDMSAGSSCSQTPSRAIPTRRVALGDGVQLPPGDYSTTPGGTLFSTTPGGRGWLGSGATWGWLGGYPGISRATGRATFGGSVAGQNAQGASGKQKGHRPRLPAFLGVVERGLEPRAANCLHY